MSDEHSLFFWLLVFFILRKDVNEFFGDPITNTIAQGYSDIIREPIDFSTMESKIEMNEYGSIMDYKVQI